MNEKGDFGFSGYPRGERRRNEGGLGGTRTERGGQGRLFRCYFYLCVFLIFFCLFHKASQNLFKTYKAKYNQLKT